MASPLSVSLPAPLRQFFALFPLYTHPSNESPHQARRITSPTLWIHVPWSPDADVLSSDVECLKWQAYLALRGLSDVFVRWDVSVDGALDADLAELSLGQRLTAVHGPTARGSESESDSDAKSLANSLSKSISTGLQFQVIRKP